MTTTHNLDFVKQVRSENSYTYKQLSDLTEYSEEYVRSWFAKKDSTKYRAVPDRAITIMKLKMINGAAA
jgi:hypothetical protein